MFTWLIKRTAALLCGSVVVCVWNAHAAAVERHSLADHVDVKARMFLEVRDADVLRGTEAGEALAEVISAMAARALSPTSAQPATASTQPVTQPATAPATQPATAPAATTATAPSDAESVSSRPAQPAESKPSWRTWFAESIGLQDERAAELLLEGRFAIASDGWQALSSAIFVGRPARIEALETQLIQRLLPATAGQRVRRYELGRKHELACDGHVVIIGPHGQGDDLYGRTVRLLSSDHGVALADLAEFQDRLAEVPADAQMVLYLGSNQRRSAGESLSGLDWLLHVPMRPQSAVLSLVTTSEGMHMEASGRLARSVMKPRAGAPPPVEELLFLPVTTIAAWTQPIDYLGMFRRLRGNDVTSLAHIFIELLEWQLPEGGLERHLFGHLVGDSVVMIGQVSLDEPRPGRHPGPPVGPTLGLWVETDHAQELDLCLHKVAGNIARLINLQGEAGPPVELREELIDARGTVVRWIPVDRLIPAGKAREFFGYVEFSWAVVDGWLIAATHHETVRQAVLARSGAVPALSIEPVRQALNHEDASPGLPTAVLVAQPDAAAMLIDTWLGYIGTHHPEMLEPRWWRQLRRRYEASQVQLGIVPMPTTMPGQVEVGQVLSDYPAEGRLESGDLIVAVDGSPLDAQQSMQALRNALTNRARDESLTLTILRPGHEGQMVVEIPMSTSAFPRESLQPLSLLRHVADLSRHFALATYTAWQPAPNMIRTRLDLRTAIPAPTPPSTAASTSPADQAGTP